MRIVSDRTEHEERWETDVENGGGSWNEDRWSRNVRIEVDADEAPLVELVRTLFFVDVIKVTFTWGPVVSWRHGPARDIPVTDKAIRVHVSGAVRTPKGNRHASQTAATQWITLEPGDDPAEDWQDGMPPLVVEAIALANPGLGMGGQR